MKHLRGALALTPALLLLTACGDNAAETPPSPPSPTASNPAMALAGTYGAAGADGQPWSTTLAPDGTYRNSVAGQLTESGRWTQTGDQLCFTRQPDAAAATPAPAVCQTLVNVNSDGALVLRDADGRETTAPRVPGGN